MCYLIINKKTIIKKLVIELSVFISVGLSGCLFIVSFLIEISFCRKIQIFTTGMNFFRGIWNFANPD